MKVVVVVPLVVPRVVPSGAGGGQRGGGLGLGVLVMRDPCPKVLPFPSLLRVVC